MKQKLDFVTNSSSVSVVMWGVYLTKSEILENQNLMAKLKELAEPEGQEEDLNSDELLYAMENILTLDTHLDREGYGIYIGKSPFLMKEDETLKQFKESVKEKFVELGINKEIGQIVQSWYDG